MRTTTTFRRLRAFGFPLVFFVGAPLAACSKKQPPLLVEDAAPPPPAASMPEVTELVPLIDDAGFDAEIDAAIKHASGGGAATTNQLRIKQCCNAMRAQAKQLGASPEANQLNAFAVQCDLMAAQAGAQGTAPEFAQLRQVLKSIKLPNACSF